jgi:hypothetical protein
VLRLAQPAPQPEPPALYPITSTQPDTPPNVLAHRALLDELSATFARKNADYGDSFAESVREHGLIAAVVRIGDKYRRIVSLLRNPAQVRETMRDTLMDCANYCVMAVMAIEKGEQ